MKYGVNIWWSDEDNAYLAEVPELPGCMADGRTMAEALAAAERIAEEWVETARALGRDVPKPIGKRVA
jgi:predicted RNase H-like HicB family nuclease